MRIDISPAFAAKRLQATTLQYLMFHLGLTAAATIGYFFLETHREILLIANFITTLATMIAVHFISRRWFAPSIPKVSAGDQIPRSEVIMVPAVAILLYQQFSVDQRGLAGGLSSTLRSFTKFLTPLLPSALVLAPLPVTAIFLCITLLGGVLLLTLVTNNQTRLVLRLRDFHADSPQQKELVCDYTAETATSAPAPSRVRRWFDTRGMSSGR